MAAEKFTLSPRDLADRLKLPHESVTGLVPDGTSVSLDSGELDRLDKVSPDARLEALKAALAKQRAEGETIATADAGKGVTVARARHGMESLKKETAVVAGAVAATGAAFTALAHGDVRGAADALSDAKSAASAETPAAATPAEAPAATAGAPEAQAAADKPASAPDAVTTAETKKLAGTLDKIGDAVGNIPGAGVAAAAIDKAKESMGEFGGMAQEMAEGYAKGGLFGAISGLLSGLFKSILGPLSKLFSGIGSFFGGSAAHADEAPKDATPEDLGFSAKTETPTPAVAPVDPSLPPAVAEKVNKPFDSMDPEAYEKWAANMADDLEKRLGVTLDGDKRKKLKDDILPNYKRDIAAIVGEAEDKQEINLGMLFGTPGIMLGFMTDLVTNDIVDPTVLGSEYLAEGTDAIRFGIRKAGEQVGFSMDFGSYSSGEVADAIAAQARSASDTERLALAHILCHQGGMVASIIGNIAAVSGRLALGVTPIQSGLPNGARMTTALLFGRQMTMADELGKIVRALEPSGVEPEYVTRIRGAVQSTAAQVHFTEMWQETIMKNGAGTGSVDDLKKLSSQIVDLKLKNPMLASSPYLNAVQEQIDGWIARGVPQGLANNTMEMAREVTRVGMPHTARQAAVSPTFRESFANSTLRQFANGAGNANLLMNELATVSTGLDARLTATGPVSRYWNSLVMMTKVERVPGTAHDTIYSINKADVTKWNQNARLLALHSPELFGSFIRGAGVIAILGLSAADNNKSFIESLGTNFLWTTRFGPLAFALVNSDRFKYDLKDQSFHGMAELALVTAQTGIDAALGAKFAARTVLRGQWSVRTLGELARFMAPVAFDAAELGAATVRTAGIARHLVSRGRLTNPATVAADEATRAAQVAANGGKMSAEASATLARTAANSSINPATAAAEELTLMGRAPAVVGRIATGTASAVGAAEATALLARTAANTATATAAAAEVNSVMGFIRSGATGMRSMGFLGTAGAVLGVLSLAQGAAAAGSEYMDQKAFEKFIDDMRVAGVITKSGEINYANAGAVLRRAGTEKVSEEQKKRFYQLVVQSQLDPSLRANGDIGTDGEVINNRLYHIDIQQGVSKPDANGKAEYAGLYDIPFKVEYTGEKVVVTFTNGPVHPHERARITQAINSMGSDAEVRMSDEARVGYVHAWKEYASDKNYADDAWVTAEAKARGIELPIGSDGRPDKTPLADALRQEFMILAGIDKPDSTDIPPAIRLKAA